MARWMGVAVALSAVMVVTGVTATAGITSNVSNATGARIAREDTVRAKGRKLPARAKRTSASRHLRAVPAATPDRGRETEAAVLGKVIAALDEAIQHPALSSGWLAAFLAARSDLAQAVSLSQRE